MSVDIPQGLFLIRSMGSCHILACRFFLYSCRRLVFDMSLGERAIPEDVVYLAIRRGR